MRSDLLPKLFFSGHSKWIPALEQRVMATLPLLPKNKLRQVSFALVSGREMARLHRQSHNDPTPTDVLTYELEHMPTGDVSEGQIVICVSVALEAAKGRTKSAKMVAQAAADELLLYSLHGLLHLTGMNDLTKKGFARMHAMEDRILVAIGAGPIFSAGATIQAATKRRSARVKGGSVKR